MGAWGVLAFDNDIASDWASELQEAEDLSIVESAFDELEEAAADYLDADVASVALAACEVVARMLGNPGYSNASTEGVDAWVAAHKVKVPAALRVRASAAIERILDDDSELRELWEEGEEGVKWWASVQEIRRRIEAQ